MPQKYSCQLAPIPLKKIWGGTALAQEWNKPFFLEQKIGESLEVSVFPENTERNSRVMNGVYSGLPLSQVLPQWEIESPLPLLVKLLEANQILSVQNHPRDQWIGGKYVPGKTEAWYILDAKPGAGVYKGFCRDTSEEEVRLRIQENCIQEILQWIPVTSGDFIYVPAGTIHAIGAGVTLIEIQQRTQATYRVYDWGRFDDEGNPRELHLEKALEVMCYQKEIALLEKSLAEVAFQCPYFQIEKKSCSGTLQQQTSFSWQILFLLQGSLTTQDGVKSHRGESLFIPFSEIKLEGEAEFLVISLASMLQS